MLARIVTENAALSVMIDSVIFGEVTFLLQANETKKMKKYLIMDLINKINKHHYGFTTMVLVN